jgi:hypothetical protein
MTIPCETKFFDEYMKQVVGCNNSALTADTCCSISASWSHGEGYDVVQRASFITWLAMGMNRDY